MLEWSLREAVIFLRGSVRRGGYAVLEFDSPCGCDYLSVGLSLEEVTPC